MMWIHLIFILSTLLFYFILFNYQVGDYYGVDSPGSHTILFHSSLLPRLEITLMWTHQVFIQSYFFILLLFYYLHILQGRWLLSKYKRRLRMYLSECWGWWWRFGGWQLSRKISRSQKFWWEQSKKKGPKLLELKKEASQCHRVKPKRKTK